MSWVTRLFAEVLEAWDFDHRQWPKGHWAVRGVFEWFTRSSASEMNIQAAITRTPASNESRSRPQRGWRRLLSVANKASPTTRFTTPQEALWAGPERSPASGVRCRRPVTAVTRCGAQLPNKMPAVKGRMSDLSIPGTIGPGQLRRDQLARDGRKREAAHGFYRGQPLRPALRREAVTSARRPTSNPASPRGSLNGGPARRWRC